jgi:formate dehydrogenase major subunit
LAYPGWGYSWLVNRRVLYNNSDVPGDVGDFYMGPDSCARLYVTANAIAGRQLNYSRWYRFYHRLSDKPDLVLAGDLDSPHFVGSVSLAGRFPGHTEPYETLRSDLVADWGRNTRGGSKWDLVPATTIVYAPDDVGGARIADTPADIVAAAASESKPAIAEPLVMTSIRCVEHFQGGPITRNNPWNVEAEPEPWVEINSLDASARGIVTGDWINVHTVRSDSIDDQKGRTVDPDAMWTKGFRARVGVGAESNQRTGKGVVAIPWHWGDKGLSKGARANDLCIDAGDANTVIPEYKACVCWITKA